MTLLGGRPFMIAKDAEQRAEGDPLTLLGGRPFDIAGRVTLYDRKRCGTKGGGRLVQKQEKWGNPSIYLDLVIRLYWQ